MSINTYTEWTRSLAIYPDACTGTIKELDYLIHGLTSEAGEVAGKFKKILRDDDSVLTTERRDDLIAELGDVFWYACRLADALTITPENVLTRNMSKLDARREQGTIQGSGDNR